MQKKESKMSLKLIISNRKARNEMRNHGSVHVEAREYVFKIECAECGSEEEYICEGTANEPLEDAMKEGWLFRFSRKEKVREGSAAIFAFCSEGCLEKYGENEDGDFVESKLGQADFTEWEGDEVRC